MRFQDGWVVRGDVSCGDDGDGDGDDDGGDDGGPHQEGRLLSGRGETGVCS